MKNLPSNPDRDLDECLSAWKVAPEVPLRFHAGVWQQIAAEESARGNTLWARINDWIAVELARPSRALIALAACLVLSVGMAVFQAQDSNARHWQQLEARYIDSINPLPHPDSAI